MFSSEDGKRSLIPASYMHIFTVSLFVIYDLWWYHFGLCDTVMTIFSKCFHMINPLIVKITQKFIQKITAPCDLWERF